MTASGRIHPLVAAAALAALAGAPATASAMPSKKDLLAARAGEAAVPAPVAVAAASAAATDRASWHKELRRRVGKRPAPVINIFNTWTHEMVAVEAGRAPDVSPSLVNRFLRCHFTNHEIGMAGELFGALVAAANHFKAARVDIISGFRAPKYNLILRKKGRNVARNSHHSHGRAVDFRLRGVSTEKLRDWARRRRLGGVGYYQNDGFVHIDVGPVRYWVGK